MRIAMWSGPRNLSTAMMYSFAQRTDCAVWDEPFFAAYLVQTGLEHPMRDETIAAGPIDPNQVVAGCIGPIPDKKSHFYQKHMTHHMLPGIDRAWMAEVTNVFLIRHPARVIASYAAKRENPTLDDIGFRQQYELYEYAKALGQEPVVIDSSDVRANPEVALTGLCEAIGLSFSADMLHWPTGGIPEDGAWAPHWYGSVWKSTGFAGAEGALPEISDTLRPVLHAALPYYEALKRLAL